MKVGQIFNLPENIRYQIGVIGQVKDKDGKLTAKYEVIEVDGILKGRVLVTYQNKRHK